MRLPSAPSRSTGAEVLTVEIVAALPERQKLIELEVPSGSTVADVIAASKILRYFPELGDSELEAGVWGRVVSRDTAVKAGDRIELYRPLLIEPREARWQLAMVGKTMSDKE